MKIKRFIQEGLKSFDFFATNEYLRQYEEPVYSTMTGGICSIIVIIILFVLLTNLGIQTINKEIINFSESIVQTNDPPEMKVQLESANFMVAFGVSPLNMNNQTIRYFDVVFQEVTFDAQLNPSNITITPLVQCTSAHFDFDSSILEYMENKVHFSRLLCPPLKFEFSIKGKFTSINPMQAIISLVKCNPANPLDIRPCATEAQLKNELKVFYNDFVANLFVINPLINPSEQNYLSYYVEDNIYISFNFDKGGYISLNVENIEINTDASLMPYEVIHTDRAFYIDKAKKETNFALNASNPTPFYVSFTFLPETSSSVYQRSFNKIDNFLSYIGGLIGTILGFLFIFRSYTETSYEIDTAKHLFSDEQNKNNSSSTNSNESLSSSVESFNFFFFVAFKLYKLLRWLGCKPNWEKMRLYKRATEELSKQLNVNYLLERILFLERTIEIMLNEHEINGLHLMKKPTIKEAESIRLRYEIKRNLHLKDENSLKKNNLIDSIQESNESFKKLNDKNFVEEENSSVSDSEAVKQHLNKIGDNIQELKEAEKESRLAKKINNNLDPFILEKFVYPILFLAEGEANHEENRELKQIPLFKQKNKEEENFIYVEPYDFEKERKE